MEESDTDTTIQKILASSLLDDRAEQVEALFAKGLAALREALRAERTILGQDGDPVCLGPDHRSRLTAGKALVELCLRNRRPAAKPPEERKRTITVEEFKKLLIAAGEMTPDGELILDGARETKRSSS